ncbi:MAG TPA: hypothetical protein VEL11_01520 [Candidatus Bathyarchaeia archaeon]|nr:hypothetical protein [Candidatus Bathyarchaeia archaeon]
MERLRQLSYLIRGLNSYNRFLQTNLNLQIKNIEKLYSTITLGTPENQGIVINKILEAFSRDDTLKILKEVGNIMGADSPEVLENISLRIMDYRKLL